jgi:hypothetical protein
MIVNNESENIWKEAVMTYFKAILQISPGGTVENSEIPH